VDSCETLQFYAGAKDYVLPADGCKLSRNQSKFLKELLKFL